MASRLTDRLMIWTSSLIKHQLGTHIQFPPSPLPSPEKKKARLFFVLLFSSVLSGRLTYIYTDIYSPPFQDADEMNMGIIK